jgi:hypothetical protein
VVLANGGSLKIAEAFVSVRWSEPTETGNVSSAINVKSQPPITSCSLRCRNVWCTVAEAFFVEFSQGVEDVFV